MASIIYLILLSVVLVLVMVMNVLSRTVLDKKNLVFFLPVLILLFCIYVTGYYEVLGKLNGLNYFECIKAAFDAFTFKLEGKIVSTLMEKDVIYAIDVYFAATLAGSTVISGILGFFKVGIDNFLSGFNKVITKDLDIVVGDPTLGAEYVKKNKNSILWVDPRVNRLNSEDKKKYFSSKITYVNQPLTGRRVKLFTWYHPGFIQIICLQNDNKYLSDVLSLIDSLDNKRRDPYRVFVQTSSELLTFVDDKLTERCQKVSGVTASSFDVYELISRRFSNEYNLARFLPRDYFKDGTIVSGKNIKVVMLGFGKTSKALFKGLVMNNQFVEINKGKYQAKPVDYYLYDVNPKCFQDTLVASLERKGLFKSLEKENVSELPCVIHHEVIDVKDSGSDDYLNRFESKKDEFTFYFVSLKDGLENALIADKLSRLVNNSNSVVFYNVDNDKEALVTSNGNIIPFGYKKSVLNHRYICDEGLWELSNAHNKAYNSYKGNIDISYSRRPIIEKMSNAYSVINYRFKLNVLGFDFSKEEGSSISEEEFYKVYDPENRRSEDKYENYFLISTRNAIAYQEHLRWATFYLLNGYTLLPLNDVKYENGKLVHKDVQNKRHACLLPYYELDKLVKLEESLLPKGEDKAKADIYKYDFQSLDKLFEMIEIAGYSIVRK